VIGYLRGVLRSREAGRVVLDVAGVGYVLHVPMSTFLELPREGEQVEMLVDTQVREDAITLYGFGQEAERLAFERLITVSGVGPRTALAALSALGPAELAAAIREADVRRLCSVPGIGKKTAERIVIDLRDRMDEAAAAAGGRRALRRGDGPEADVVSALVNLGYAEKQVSRAVADAVEQASGKKPDFDDLLRQALQRLGRTGQAP
jgi:Holliday junction DNA helicase RuvA